MKIICFFLPAILAVGLYEKLFNKDLKLKELIYNYVLFNIIINFMANIFILISGSGILPLDDVRLTSRFVIKYLVMSIILSIIVPIIIGFMKETFKLEISIERTKEKKSEKK